jgi:predicted negative regulator of RcsB-dependent stress response
MNQKLFEANYDVTKKNKFFLLYEKNKILIYSLLILIITTFISANIYFSFQEKKKISLSEMYIDAKVYLEKNEKDKAKNILKEIIFENDSTYSTLGLFLIINQKLISNNLELTNLFDHVLENNKLPKNLKNLLIFKKILLNSNSIEEDKLLEAAKPLLNSDTIWKPHALLLIGDYFSSKSEGLKAIEFYNQILTAKDVPNDIFNHAKLQIALISNE